MKGAILVIGSLLWDSDIKGEVGARKKWRNKWLNVIDKIHVKVPIRYGRLSGDTKEKYFTMIFSKECESLNLFGTAYLIPLKNQNVKTFKGIENEARRLSNAEGGTSNKLCKGNDKKWATVGILLNPKLSINVKNTILNSWSNLLKEDGGLLDFQDYKVRINEESIISEKGELLIQWISTVDNSNEKSVNEFDFILTTCVKPNIPDYPSANEIASKLVNDKRKYFFSNIENGITTFQDRDVVTMSNS